jgi:hypothetical protein
MENEKIAATNSLLTVKHSLFTVKHSLLATEHLLQGIGCKQAAAVRSVYFNGLLKQ